LNILIAGAGYVIVGIGTAYLAGAASSPAGVKGWRLAAWLLSLAVFVLHFVIERARRLPASRVALRVALGVGLGAFGVAALGPVRTHWGQPHLMHGAVLSLGLWPIATGVPAFGVALIAGFVIDRLGRGTPTSLGAEAHPSVDERSK
jgi:hypothetical protein